MPKLVNARDFGFPKSLVVPFTWMHTPNALSLSDAINSVSQHGEREIPGVRHHKSSWYQESITRISPPATRVFHLSDPLTYWWGVTLCPPELNDVSLAENLVILMRYAAIKEINLNTEAQKPSLTDVLEFQGPRMTCAV